MTMDWFSSLLGLILIFIGTPLITLLSGKRINVFGESHIDEVAADAGIKVLARLPIDPKIAQMVDAGQVEYLELPWLDEAAAAVEGL